MFRLKSAVIRFTCTEGDLRILRRPTEKQGNNASSTKVHLASHLLLNMVDDVMTIPDRVHQDGCVTQSGYMSIDRLLDM